MSETIPTNQHRRRLAIVLAAGEGTRMKSAKPKVLHEIAGRPMVIHVLATIAAAGCDQVAVVIGPGRDDVARVVKSFAPHAQIFVQSERHGTAHAVLSASTAIAEGYDELLIAFADTPLITAASLQNMSAALRGGAQIAVLGFEAANPVGYGRLLTRNEELVAIREQKDATEEERKVRLCNAGLMALDGRRALEILRAIGNDNSQKEYYLTDCVEIARMMGLRAVPLIASEEEVMGVNDRIQLAAAEQIFQRRARQHWMREGVTMIAPETVFLSFDTELARDVVLEPNVIFGPNVRIYEGAVIHANSHLEGAIVSPRATIGPYARLRPGSEVGEGAKIGNFVETKAAKIGAGAKVNHLSYIGDATIGAKANIGAGTITCNYDGFSKFKTTIGANAFVGSNSSLVAPVNIGEGAFVGSGSVITEDVSADALAIARGRQVEKNGWASIFRAEHPAKHK